jgi:hypothetical protein
MEGRIFYDDVESDDENSILCGRHLSEPADVGIHCALSGFSAVSPSPAVSANCVFVFHPGFFAEVLFGPAACCLSFHLSLHPPKPSRLILLFTILDQILVEEA